MLLSATTSATIAPIAAPGGKPQQQAVSSGRATAKLPIADQQDRAVERRG